MIYERSELRLHVLLSQGFLPSALPIARCLARAGHRVTVGDNDPLVIARFSRYSSGFVDLPPPALAPRRFFEAVVEATVRGKVDVVLPLFEEGFFLAAYWDLGAVQPACFPPFELALMLADKGTGVERAARAGLHVATTLPATTGAAELERALGYPLVVKPRISSSGVGVRVVGNIDELSNALSALTVPTDHVAQSWAGRRELVFQGVFDSGRCIAAHAYQVLCRHPPEHGFGILLESLVDEAILDQGIRLGADVGYHGALGIDFLADGASKPRVVEINPRLVLGVSNAIDSGVPIPALVVELGRTNRPTATSKTPRYRAGVRTMHWPSKMITNLTGETMHAQLWRWLRNGAGDPGALAAFFAHVVAHRIRGGFDTAALETRGLSSDIVRKLRDEVVRRGHS